jgi:hypothetical protein
MRALPECLEGVSNTIQSAVLTVGLWVLEGSVLLGITDEQEETRIKKKEKSVYMPTLIYEYGRKIRKRKMNLNCRGKEKKCKIMWRVKRERRDKVK